MSTCNLTERSSIWSLLNNLRNIDRMNEWMWPSANKNTRTTQFYSDPNFQIVSWNILYFITGSIFSQRDSTCFVYFFINLQQYGIYKRPLLYTNSWHSWRMGVVWKFPLNGMSGRVVTVILARRACVRCCWWRAKWRFQLCKRRRAKKNKTMLSK